MPFGRRSIVGQKSDDIVVEDAPPPPPPEEDSSEYESSEYESSYDGENESYDSFSDKSEDDETVRPRNNVRKVSSSQLSTVKIRTPIDAYANVLRTKSIFESIADSVGEPEVDDLEDPNENDFFLKRLWRWYMTPEVPTEMPTFGLYDAAILGLNLTVVATNSRQNSSDLFNLEIAQSKRKISSRQVATLASVALAFNESTRALSFANCVKVRDRGCNSLFNSLQYNHTVLSVCVSNCSVTDMCIPSIISCLTVNQTIIHLDLSRNSITLSGMIVLGEFLRSGTSCLTSLDVSHNSVLGDAVTETLARVLRSNDRLTSLDVSSCKISNTGALTLVSSLVNNFTLNTLFIHGKDLDEGLLEFNIDTQGALEIASKLLKTNPAFANIEIANSTIPIAKLCGSRWVELPDRNWVEIDMMIMKTILPLNTKLMTLDLSDNPRIGRWGILPLLEAVVGIPTLRSVNVSNTGLFPEVSMDLGTILISNQTYIERFVIDTYVFDLQRIIGAKEFPLCQKHTVSLGSNTGLQREVEIPAGKQVADFKKTLLSPIEERLLGTLLTINQKIFMMNGIFVEDTIDYWDLSSKRFSYYELTFVALRAGHHRHLTRLYLTKCGMVAENAVVLAAELANNVLITTLDLEYNELRSDGADAIGDCLSHNSALTSVNLSWNHIGDYGMQSISNALGVNKVLETLELRGNELSRRGIKILCEGLASNVTLTTLRLRWNHLCPQSGVSLGEMLMVNCGLTWLDLEEHCIGAKGVHAIARALGKNKVLKILNIRGDSKLYPGSGGIGKEGATDLAEMLRNNKALQELYMGDNKITLDGSVAMAHSLKTNTVLRVLDLSYADMDGVTASILFKYIEKHPALVELDLQGNYLALEGSQSCVKLICSDSTSLTNLNLSKNDINEEGIVLFANSISKFSKTLTRLTLLENRASDRTKIRLGEAPRPLIIDI